MLPPESRRLVFHCAAKQLNCTILVALGLRFRCRRQLFSTASVELGKAGTNLEHSVRAIATDCGVAGVDLDCARGFETLLHQDSSKHQSSRNREAMSRARTLLETPQTRSSLRSMKQVPHAGGYFRSLRRLYPHHVPPLVLINNAHQTSLQ